jgi:branched-chain amino acid transport system permease protein
MADRATSASGLDHRLGGAWAAGLLAALVALPVVAQALGGEFYIGLASRILIFALAATSLNLVLGFGGMVSFGHAAFVGIGAYTVAILAQSGLDSVLLAWPAAMAVAGAAAFAVGAVSLRTQGVYFIMITLAFAQMLYFLMVSLKSLGGDDGLNLAGRSRLPGIDLADDTRFFYVVLVACTLGFLAVWRLLNSPFGHALQAVRENPVRMAALGFGVRRIQAIAFTVAGALAGLAGALLANQGSFVSPSMMQWHQSGVLMVMVILGGVGHLWGGVLGAVAFLLLEEILGHYTIHWQFILGAMLLAVVLVAPNGLASLPARWTSLGWGRRARPARETAQASAASVASVEERP